MGMFDSLYDADGGEWQTKAYDCLLARFEIGDALPSDQYDGDYQVKVLGGPCDDHYVRSYATVRQGVLAAVPAERDTGLPLVDYHGGWLELVRHGAGRR